MEMSFSIKSISGPTFADVEASNVCIFSLFMTICEMSRARRQMLLLLQSGLKETS